MIIKKVGARSILDSRGEKTIEVSVNGCKASAPFGASRGKHEVISYKKSLINDIKIMNNLEVSKLPEIKKFNDLIGVERVVKSKIGGNTLFAFEAAILRALAKSLKKELYEVLGKGRRIPKLLSNTIGGGAHSHVKNNKKPDFQEFLIIGNKKQNIQAYKELKKILKSETRNDEGAMNTTLCNKHTIELISYGDIEFGTDIAASSFYSKGKYNYKNPKRSLTKQQQINFIFELIKDYGLSYVEDPLNEEDFSGFAMLLKKAKKIKGAGSKCLIVGDDLTTTNLKRVQKAIKLKSINGLIVKPNQIGSLIEVKKVCELCKNKGIKIIVSHRSGETNDSFIADLAIAIGAVMIKTSVIGKERLAKVNRLEKIGKKI
jgi:enolase